ncbi:hypothetical protein MMC13_007291 [Lambiella insularis]|nr:hypothetical protein [Lambiella insularis]
MANVTCDLFLEIELMTIAFATGIMDAVTFPDYHVFASNQTGNTALLAVGALGIGQGIVDLRHVGLSLGAFVAGGLICCQLGNSIGCMSRVWLLTTNVFQTALVFAAAALRTYTDDVNDEPLNMSIIMLLAFASGAQVASARSVHIPEITTAMVTSAYIDFLIDPDIFKIQNRSRNRRLFFVGSLVLGSFVGAIAYKFVSPALALYLSAAGKALVCVALLFNPEGKRDINEASYTIEQQRLRGEHI